MVLKSTGNPTLIVGFFILYHGQQTVESVRRPLPFFKNLPSHQKLRERNKLIAGSLAGALSLFYLYHN